MKHFAVLCSMFLFSCVLVSCAISASGNDVSLQQEFEEYQQFMRIQEGRAALIKDAQAYFSDRKWHNLRQTYNKAAGSSNEADRLIVDRALVFPLAMTSVLVFKEHREDAGGCLFVEGVDETQDPVVFFISYVYEGGRWVIDEMATEYYTDNTEPYIKEPICNMEQRDALWLEQFQ